VRITGGEFRGRVFTPPRRPEMRPSMEKVRLAVFSMLDSLGMSESARVLDCYAGSGAYGFEALSRGAQDVTFLERDRALLDFISEVGKSLGVSDLIDVMRVELPSGVQNAGGPFNLVFVDPPYAEYSVDFSEQLRGFGLLAPGAIIVSESAKRGEGQNGDYFSLLKDKVYGDTRVRIYRLEVEKQGQGNE